MTEAEWLRCIDVRAMVACLPWGKRQRKARLFACACCGQLSDVLQDPWCRRAIEIVERFVDGGAAESEWDVAQLEVRRAIDEIRDQHPYPDYVIHPRHAVRMAVRWVLSRAGSAEMMTAVAVQAVQVAGLLAVVKQARAPAGAQGLLRSTEMQERQRQCRLLRDIVGNPFRPVGVDPLWLSWRDGTVPKIAEAIYQERAFDRLPILADALEDAGCTNEDMLTHCRQPGEHVRGCWAVDLLTGRD